MREGRFFRRMVVVLSVGFVCLVVVGSAAQAQAPVRIKKMGACTSAANCDIDVMDRGVGLCRTPANHAGCLNEVKWMLTGNLSTGFKVVIEHNEQASSGGSRWCFVNQVQKYEMVGNGGAASVTAKLDPNQCKNTKMTWMYTVTLFKGNAIWASDDPGVIIDN